MTIAYDNSNGVTGSNDTSSPFAALNRSTPATSAGDLMFIVSACKPYSTNWTLDDSNYNLLVDAVDGTTAMGNGTGSMHMQVWAQQATGSLGAVTLTPNAQYSPNIRASVKFTAADDFDLAATYGTDSSASGTSFSASFNDALDIKAGDHLMLAVCHPDDPAAAAYSSINLSIPGLTLGTLTQRLSPTETTSGNDASLVVYECAVVSGTATGAGSFSVTVSSGDSSGIAALVRMREGIAPTSDFALTSRASGSGPSSAQTTTSSSFTPSANSTLVAFANGIRGNHLTPINWSITDSAGLTWTKQAETTDADGGQFGGTTAVWTAEVGASPSSMTVTFDPFAGGTQLGYVGFEIFDIVGPSGPVSLAQSPGTNQAGGYSGSNTGSLAVSLPSSPTDGNLVIGLFGAQNDTAGAFAAITGFTELASTTAIVAHCGVWYRDDTTSTTITQSDLGQNVWNAGAIALEFDITPPPTQKIEDFEDGTNGSDYTNSSGLASGGSGTAVATYQTGAAAEGALGLRSVTTTAGDLLNRYIPIDNGSADQCYGHFALRGTLPSSIITIFQMRENANTLVVMRLNTDGTISIRDNNTTRQTSTTAIDPTRWTQVGFGFNGSSVVMKIYDESGAVSESEVTGAYSGSSVPNELRFGTITDPGNNGFTLEWDYVGYNTGEYIDPLVIAAASEFYVGIPMS